MRNVWSVSVNIVASEVRSKKNKPKGEKGTRRKTYSAKKSGTSSSGPAGPATTALATFPTGGHKAQRHIQGYMSKLNTNKEVTLERSVRKLLEGKTSITSLKALSIRK